MPSILIIKEREKDKFMITMGYDIGTRFLKACVVKDGQLIGSSIEELGVDLNRKLKTAKKIALKEARIRRWQVKREMMTGYGATLFDKKSSTISEESCVVRACRELNEDIGTIIDVGSLFIHVVTIGKDGMVKNFCVNEKCAAGSGKFLETIASAIEIPFFQLSEHALQSQSTYKIDSNCAVFGESAVISAVNAGENSCDILSGILYAISEKVATLINRLEITEKIAIVGGVSKVDAFRYTLEDVLGLKVLTLPIDFQMAAAYGAALYAGDNGR